MNKNISVALFITLIVIAMLSITITRVKTTNLAQNLYSVKNTVQYENPITKEIEDLKLKKEDKEYNSKKILGDSMSRAIIGQYSLLDCSSDKKTLTIKVLASDTIKDYKIYLKNIKDDNYKEVKFKLIKKDKKNNTKDIKFDVNSEEAYIKIKVNVSQMGRDVIFFAQINAEDAKEGADEFNTQKIKNISSTTVQ